MSRLVSQKEVNPYKRLGSYYGQEPHRKAFEKLEYTGDITVERVARPTGKVGVFKYKINKRVCGNLNSGQARALIYLMHNLDRDVSIKRLYEVAGKNGARGHRLDWILDEVNTMSEKFHIVETEGNYRMEKVDNKSKDNNDDKTELPKLSTVVVDNYRLFKEGDKVISVWGGAKAKPDELFDFGLNKDTIQVHLDDSAKGV